MKAKEAMIVWTPDRPPFEKSKIKGQVAVTTIPEPPALREHMKSVGACDHDWNEADDEGRKEIAQRVVTEMLHEDNIPLDSVEKAMREIDEYADFPFSTVKPEKVDEDEA